MRQPDGMRTPAASPASSSGVPPPACAVLPERRNVRVPPSPVSPVMVAGRNRSTCSRSVWPASLQYAVSSSSMALGPQAQVCRSARSGTASWRSAGDSRPPVRVCRSTSRIFRSRARARSSPPKSTSRAVGAECTTTTSLRLAERRMPITGVMPLPAVTKRIFSGACPGTTKSPAGRSRPRSMPGRALPMRCRLTAPSSTAVTVTVSSPSGRWGALVSEYARHSRTPSTSTPSRRYCPGSCRRQPRPGRSVRVTARSVSGWTATTLARSTSRLRSGATTSR